MMVKGVLEAEEEKRLARESTVVLVAALPVHHRSCPRAVGEVMTMRLLRLVLLLPLRRIIDSFTTMVKTVFTMSFICMID